MDCCVCSWPGASRFGCLLAYLIKTNKMREIMGMLITMVSSATTMMKFGSLGGGAREHLESSAFHVHRDASDCTLEEASVQPTCYVSENEKGGLV